MKRSRILGIALVLAGVSALGTALAVAQDVDPGDIFEDPTNETSKQEIMEEDAALIAAGEASLPPKPDDPENAAPSTDPGDVPAWNEGVFKGGEDFPSGAGYAFNTVWRGTEGDKRVTVYAGSYADSNVSIVLVDYLDATSWQHSFKGPFEAPIEGPLVIREATDTVLRLTGSDQDITFDVGTLTFSKA